jgi:mono/diheme cytochrome c family protein
MHRLLVLCLLLTSAVTPSARAADREFDALVKPFLTRHCVTCHGTEKAKGDFRVDTLAPDFAAPRTAMRWEEIMGRVNSGDMPPRGKARPPADEVARLSEWVTGQLAEAEARGQAGRKVAFRRLTREEYANTIRELLGVTVDVADPTGLPEDPDWHGFQRVGAVLTLSPAHIEKYYAAAEAALNEALPAGSPPKREVVRWNAFDLRGGSWKKYEKDYQARGIADRVRADIVPNNGALDDHTLQVKRAGDYLVRVRLSGLRPEGGRAPRLRLYDAGISRLLFERDVEAPEDKPITLEFRTHLPVGNHNVRIMNAVPGPNPEDRRSRSSEVPNAFTSLRTRVPWQMKFTDDDGKPIVPFLLLDSVEWDGPVLESWPTPAHQRIFLGEESAKDVAQVRRILGRFAERAWRRPVRPADLDRLVKLAETARKTGDSFEESIKTALLAVLTSKSFLYLQEGDPEASSPRLTDWELASRLSYFLWSSMPDQRLFDLARAGELSKPEVRRTEVRRMLADPKAAAFAESFPRQWLQLRKVGMFTPDRTLYPEYDEYLEKSMVAETTGFFRAVLKKNLSLREFLDSDWTMLNERLASHYGITGVSGEAMRRVPLLPEHHRGGLLTQASVLSLTSDGTRHRPVHRGVWVLESIVGKPPPPPPANVPALGTPAAAARKTTVREKLELHRADINCAGCHRRIDPLGLAFDNYDAIGRWRDVEAVRAGTGADPRLDPSGELPDGRKFADAAGLKRLLVDDVDRFAVAFTEKLATYALRRGMTFGDRADLNRLAEQSKPNGYRLAALIEAFGASELFGRR